MSKQPTRKVTKAMCLALYNMLWSKAEYSKQKIAQLKEQLTQHVRSLLFSSEHDVVNSSVKDFTVTPDVQKDDYGKTAYYARVTMCIPLDMIGIGLIKSIVFHENRCVYPNMLSIKQKLKATASGKPCYISTNGRPVTDEEFAQDEEFQKRLKNLLEYIPQKCRPFNLPDKFFETLPETTEKGKPQ